MQGSIPTFIHISHGKNHDNNALDFIPLKRDSIYLMDKAYIDFKALYEMEQVGAFFVTQAKLNMNDQGIEINYNIDEKTEFINDQLIVSTGVKPIKQSHHIANGGLLGRRKGYYTNFHHQPP